MGKGCTSRSQASIGEEALTESDQQAYIGGTVKNHTSMPT